MQHASCVYKMREMPELDLKFLEISFVSEEPHLPATVHLMNVTHSRGCKLGDYRGLHTQESNSHKN